MSCEDQPRSGQTSTCRCDENLEKIHNTINVDRRRTIIEISQITGLSWSSCQRTFEYEKCFHKIRSSVVDRGSKKQSFQCLL